MFNIFHIVFWRSESYRKSKYRQGCPILHSARHLVFVTWNSFLGLSPCFASSFAKPRQGPSQIESHIPKQKWSFGHIFPCPSRVEFFLVKLNSNLSSRIQIFPTNVKQQQCKKTQHHHTHTHVGFSQKSRKSHKFHVKSPMKIFDSFMRSAKRSMRTTRQGRHFRSRPCQYLEGKSHLLEKTRISNPF